VAFQKGDSDTYAREEAAIQKDLNQLKSLLGPNVTLVPGSQTPSPAPTPTP
jgi:hypothetical protein